MLEQKLRKLRLGHAAFVLEAHHQAAINAKLGYLEFLEILIDDELSTRDNKGLDKRLRAARFPVTKTLDLIILDELGFTPLNRVVADHLFRIVSERYERGSIIVTSNKPFEQWAEMFVDPILANAALDRLIHHAHVVPVAGESYRMKDRRPPAQPTAGKPARAAKSAG